MNTETKKPTINELIENKPSKALQAMVDGLERTKNWSTFIVEMSTFGCRGLWRTPIHEGAKNKKALEEIQKSEEHEICYGCAATCTLMELAHERIPFDLISNTDKRVEWLGKTVQLPSTAEENDLYDFETAMDLARMGDLEDLFRFCGYRLDEVSNDYKYYDYQLTTETWPTEIRKVKQVIKQLQAAGY